MVNRYNWSEKLYLETLKEQKAVIEENERQQEIAVDQFRQAQEEIQRLQAENSNLRRLLATFSDEENDPFGVVKRALNSQLPAAWEGDAE
ncbi:hypothetical protein RJD11_12120 [Bacillus velezensis]|uniref:hypothetical protein n=1 Tax=Bacillus TaxID=1386 RepID=UPI001C531A8E|nr:MULTISPECIES: hypothetical protein [Bacillus amyloliquefaciens group]QXP99332.1 hypothetical protein KVY05_21385 [Bacillus velezensis]UHH01338.1 hypothetical protein LUA14_12045 [Bacillus amyloliquefaciens]ULR21086.1 hypothetical protein MJE83_12045 [Bacillus velezensis]UVW07829.1 hypothetical protein NX856_12085 [Bacillus velezensis]WHL75135.1 hypothetical protein QLH34_12065 [Bacillus velezensis]